MRGQYLEPITDDLKEKFLELIESGYSRPEAADALGTTPRIMRSICNPNSTRYDEDFARQYAKLTEKGGEQENGLKERLEAAAIERGIRSSDRLLEKLLIIYSEEWKVHRPQAMQVNFKVDEMKAVFANLSDDTLQKMIAELEQKNTLELEAGGDVIDA